MPPPYWRGSGAIFHVIASLEAILDLLNRLLPIHQSTESDLEAHYAIYNDIQSDKSLENFAEICCELWDLEHKIKINAEVAILMSAIQAEDDVNRFCVFNIHKDIAESVEKLSPPEKLLIAAASVGVKDTKSGSIFESIKKLTAWRNSFAHGHCTDRPIKSLRHNHLIHPEQYPSAPSMLLEMTKLVGWYIDINRFLASISVNSYTSGTNLDTEQVEESLALLSRFKFTVYSFSNDVYDLEHQ